MHRDVMIWPLLGLFPVYFSPADWQVYWLVRVVHVPPTPSQSVFVAVFTIFPGIGLLQIEGTLQEEKLHVPPAIWQDDWLPLRLQVRALLPEPPAHVVMSLSVRVHQPSCHVKPLLVQSVCNA